MMAIDTSQSARRHTFFRTAAYWGAIACAVLSIIFRNAGFSHRYRYAVVVFLTAWVVSHIVERVQRRFV